MDYNKLYLAKKNISLKKYLYVENKNENFDKNKFENKLKEDSKKLNISYNLIKQILLDDFELNPDNTNEIDIYSPLFNEIINNEHIIDSFDICINTKFIEKNKLHNDYKIKFKQMNEKKINYSGIILYYKGDKDIDYFKKFDICYSQIKRLTLKNCIPLYYEFFSYITFFGDLFSLKDIEKNLLVLNIQIDSVLRDIDPSLLEKINSFNLLEDLSLSYFSFKNEFEIKLKNLKVINFESCKNILLTENCSDLKELKITDSILVKPQKILKMKNLEKIDFYYGKPNLCEIIDFSELNKLTYLICNVNDFLKLNESQLKYINIYDYQDFSGIKNKIFEKIISIKSIKELKMKISEKYISQIKNIEGENKSLTKAELNFRDIEKNCELTEFQKKFPNLLKLNLFGTTNIIQNKEIYIDIKEDSNCKVNHLSLVNYSGQKIKLFIQDFQTLNYFDLSISNKITNLKNVLPIFNDDCFTTF